MYILSDFHDYYDTCSSLGIDKQCPYQRKKVEYEHKLGRSTDTPSVGSEYLVRKNGRHYKYKIFYRLVGFCGKIYPVVLVEKYGLSGSESGATISFFFNPGELLDHLSEEKVQYKQSRWYWRSDHTLDSVSGLASFFNPDTWKHFLVYFQKHKVPIFILGSKYCILNPCLKDYGFQKIKDTFTAYQDIYMYISGVIGVETKPTVKISDKDMAESKGHGGKYSFRKPPGGKRGKPRWR